jgi:hypothetical protein
MSFCAHIPCLTSVIVRASQRYAQQSNAWGEHTILSFFGHAALTQAQSETGAALFYQTVPAIRTVTDNLLQAWTFALCCAKYVICTFIIGNISRMNINDQ